MPLTTRRSFLGLLSGAIAAPMIVKAASLMPIKALTPEVLTPEAYMGGPLVYAVEGVDSFGNRVTETYRLATQDDEWRLLGFAREKGIVAVTAIEAPDVAIRLRDAPPEIDQPVVIEGHGTKDRVWSKSVKKLGDDWVEISSDFKASGSPSLSLYTEFPNA